uniref:Rho-GAP domain-containing protein n=1 Tax=Ditylenchus dipsaci TaxID=166011 RepID=A0A915EVF2_9BILA
MSSWISWSDRSCSSTKNEKHKRVNWSMYSSCSLWQQLVDDTKEEAKQRGITAEVYGTHVTSSISTRCSSLQKISKKCREIGVLAQGEIIRVLTELQTAMKTYQLCYSEFSVSSRKLKSVQKSFNKRTEKFEAARLKCNRARNEYLLCIDAANAALHKFFADDLSDLIDCSDLGMEYWLNLILSNIIAARKAACQTEMNALANLGSFKDSLQPQQDKQKFFESNSSTFMLPKRFEFKCDANETIDQISLGEGLSEELKQRHHQIKKRLSTLRAESDASWRTLEETEQRIKGVLNASTLIDITEFGIADGRPPADSLENELAKAYDNYLQNFSFYLFNANLIMRLEARADGIGNALTENGILLPVSNSESPQEHEETRDMGHEELADWHERSRRKKRIGSQASAALMIPEYTEFGLHHQGIFRVSGSQVEINHIKEAFERGEDPLRQPDISTLNKASKGDLSIAQISFAFLNHLSEFSDENMMDPYNLAICFGPTLLPIPDGKDQVYYQNYVNEVVKNLIVHSDAIFSSKAIGPRYQKYDPISTTTDNTEIELYVDDTDEYFGGLTNNGGSSATSGEVPNGTFSSELFDYTALQKTLDELEFQHPRPVPNGTGLLANYQQHPMPSLMNTSAYSNRLPPSVTATLVKTSGNGVNPTYCYSSQSSENGSSPILNGKSGLDLDLKGNKLTDGIPDRDGSQVLSPGAALEQNRGAEAVGSSGNGVVGVSSGPSKAQKVVRLGVTALGLNVGFNDNYAAIAAKSDRIRIAMAPPSPISASNLTSPIPTSQSNQPHRSTPAVRPSKISVSSHPTPPSYTALYGQDRPLSSAIPNRSAVHSTTIHLPINNTRSSNGSASKTGGRPNLVSPTEPHSSPIKTSLGGAVNYRLGLQPDYRSPTTVKYSPKGNETVEDPKIEPEKRSQSPVKRLVQLMATDSLTTTAMPRE